MYDTNSVPSGLAKSNLQKKTHAQFIISFEDKRLSKQKSFLASKLLQHLIATHSTHIAANTIYQNDLEESNLIK